MRIEVACPNCGEILEIEEHVGVYAILSNDHPVTCCPGCLCGLVIEDGTLKVDQNE